MSEITDQKIEVCLKEYDNLWSYYVRTLDERSAMISYYYKVVTIPGALLGTTAVLLRTSQLNVKGFDFSLVAPIFTLILFVIFFVGIGQFIAYTMEASNSSKYLTALNAIRTYLRSHLELDNILVIDKLRGVGGGGYMFGSIKMWRASVIPIINSAIACFIAMALGSELTFWNAVLYFMSSIVAHFVLYFLVYVNY